MAEHFDFTNPTTELTPAQLRAIETRTPLETVTVGPFDYDENLQNFYQELREQQAAAAAAEELARYDRIADALVDVNGAYDKIALGAE